MFPWNEPILEAFKARLARLPHAILIHGAQGVGKLGLAERIAQTLLCEGATKPCGVCEGCRWFAAASHPDFRRVEPEALAKEPVVTDEDDEAPARKGKPSIEIKIEQVRALSDFLNIGSHRGKLRVALIHPAEDMNVYAANALLKALEEPPPGAVFILVSHRPARLLPTVRSRCVALAVPIPPREAALQWLSAQGAKNAERWLAYAGGAPLRAMDYSAAAAKLDAMLRAAAPVEDRDDLELFADALQKISLDRALAAFGLPAKYGTAAAAAPSQATGWLRFMREMGERRALCRHPLNARLFSAEMLAALPKSRETG